MKKIFNKYKLFYLMGIVFFIVLPFFAKAQIVSSDIAEGIEWQMKAVNDKDIFSDASMIETISTVIKTFLSLLGVIFLVLMLIGGFNWMTAQGDEAKIEKAKSTIQSAIIGLIIVVAAYSITFTIFRAL